MKKKHIGTIVLVLIAITTIAQCDSMKMDLKTCLEGYFKQQFSNQTSAVNSDIVPGLSMIITNRDSIIFIGNYGSSDLDKASPITENTIFDIASTAKQITGMAIALLVDKGEIDPNEKIVKYLTDLPDIMNDITVNQLLHHSSGIRDWPILFALKGWQPEESLSINEIYAILKMQDGLNFKPGTEFLYSNSNYNLLAKIVEVVTDTSFNSWVNDHIFAPLGMENSCFCKNENNPVGVIANSYIYNGQKYLPFNNRLYAPGSSSLKSNTSDMAKWLMNFYHKTLGGSQVYNLITQRGSVNNNQVISYGYGLNVIEVNNMQVFMHDGAWGGFRSGTVFFSEENIGIVILSNNGTLQPKKMIKDIADIVFCMKEDTKEKDGGLMEKEVNEDFFALCAGTYEQVDDKNCHLTFFKNGDAYFVNVYDKDFKLYAKSDSVFFVKEAEVELIFHLENGKVDSHTMKQNGKKYLAFKVKENSNEISVDYNLLVGSYYSNELDVKYEVKFEHNELIIVSPLFFKDIILEHSDGLSFVSDSGLIQSITFLGRKRSINSFIINNQRSRNIRFEKVI